MRFFVSDIRNSQVVELEESVNAQELLGAPPALVTFERPVTSKVQARMTRDGDVVFSGRIATVIRCQCGRCLEYFDRPVSSNFQHVRGSEEDVIDVTSEIRETLLVDLPVRILCREDCLGICALCGKNRNMGDCRCTESHNDPRWDALKKFRST